MALSDKQIKLAKRIDDHAKKVFAAGGDEEALLLGMSDFMSTFKAQNWRSCHEVPSD
jgi:hypothetical protein